MTEIHRAERRTSRSERGSTEYRAPPSVTYRGGKVIGEMVDLERYPPLTFRSARHGPRGNRDASVTETDSTEPGDKSTPSLASNGPALSPPGPFVKVNAPMRSSVLPPVLRTVADTTEVPEALRAHQLTSCSAGSGPMWRGNSSTDFGIFESTNVTRILIFIS